MNGVLFSVILMILASHWIHLNTDSIHNYTIVRILAFPTLIPFLFPVPDLLFLLLRSNIRKVWIPEIFLKCYCLARKTPIRDGKTYNCKHQPYLFVVLWLACVSCVCVWLLTTCISSLLLFCGGVFLLFILKVITNRWCCWHALFSSYLTQIFYWNIS